MKGTLYIQLDQHGRKYKTPTPLECSITLARDNQVVAEKDGLIIAGTTRARVVFIAADGIFLAGVVDTEPYPKLQHQTWWFEPMEGAD